MIAIQKGRIRFRTSPFLYGHFNGRLISMNFIVIPEKLLDAEESKRLGIYTLIFIVDDI